MSRPAIALVCPCEHCDGRGARAAHPVALPFWVRLTVVFVINRICRLRVHLDPHHFR
jgi:hypothetical protein